MRFNHGVNDLARNPQQKNEQKVLNFIAGVAAALGYHNAKRGIESLPIMRKNGIFHSKPIWSASINAAAINLIAFAFKNLNFFNSFNIIT